MKARTTLIVAVMASATLFAQTTTSQSGSTTDEHSQHHPTTTAPAQNDSNQASGMQMGGMSGHMAAMQADMQQMRTQVDKMRMDAQKVKDPDTRAALLENAALWQQFLDRMQNHMQMMGGGMMGQGMGMHGMMGPGADHGCSATSGSGGCQMMEGKTPPKTTPPPKPQ